MLVDQKRSEYFKTEEKGKGKTFLYVVKKKNRIRQRKKKEKKIKKNLACFKKGKKSL